MIYMLIDITGLVKERNDFDISNTVTGINLTGNTNI
jgi:hypothetical protein